ncbi:MAG: radical SAM family heme chaperone HemW [Acetobacter sp.]
MPNEPLALYIHWPFCLAKCPYCDFNSHVRAQIPQARFAKALRAELAHDAQRLGRRRLTSIFFGGGTPSLMAPETVAALIEDATTLFDAAPDLEITLEANPTSVEAGRLHQFRQAGVNRVSLGIQALNDRALTFLGREHSALQARKALETARALFPRLTFDLIYARPEQSVAAWREELTTALALADDHLSLYQLTIEPGTRFEALYRKGDFTLPDDDTAAALYDATAELTQAHGMAAYEVSNYARPGSESQHNLTYWRYADYLGIGPGAHGRLSFGTALKATRRHRAPEPWAERVESTGTGQTSEEDLTPHDRAQEMLLMGLRVHEGIDLLRFHARTGMTLDSAVDQSVLAQALHEGYLTRTAHTLAATPEGRLRLEALLAALVL